MVFSVALTFKKIVKMSFKKPEFDIITSMLFLVLALFLSLRSVLEQWFVWAIPFLIILCVVGKVKGRLFWGASILALLYALELSASLLLLASITLDGKQFD